MTVTQVLVIAGAALEILAAILVAADVLTRWAALVLFVFTGITIYYFHDFWNVGGPELMIAFNRLSIMGALLVLAAVSGPKARPRFEDLSNTYRNAAPETSAAP